MTKAELQVKISELEASLKVNELSQTDLINKLVDAQKELENINKPKISEHTMDQIYSAIEEAIDNFDFDDRDNYEADFTIDYDNRLALENIRFDGVSSIAEDVHREVEKLFNVIPSEQND